MILLSTNLRLNMNTCKLSRASLRSSSGKRQFPTIGEVLAPWPSLGSQTSRKERWKSARSLKQSARWRISSLINLLTHRARWASLTKTNLYFITATYFTSFKISAGASMSSDATRPNYCVTSATWSQATRRKRRSVSTRTGHITLAVFVKVATRRFTTRWWRTQGPMRPIFKR